MTSQRAQQPPTAQSHTYQTDPPVEGRHVSNMFLSIKDIEVFHHDRQLSRSGQKRNNYPFSKLIMKLYLISKNVTAEKFFSLPNRCVAFAERGDKYDGAK